MKNISLLLRQLFHKPNKQFSHRLRVSLLRHFSEENKHIEGKMYFLVSEKPEEQFKHDLRAALLQKMSMKKKSQWKKTFSSFRTKAALSFATVLLFSVALFGLSSTGVASGTTSLSSFSGKVFIGKQSVLEDGEALVSGETITTKENSFATLSFFEDSLVRMDENTEITITNLTPHTLRADLGEVKITLQKGRIWVRSASANEQYSHFIVSQGWYETVLDFGGAAEIFAQKQELVVSVWDRIVRIVPPVGEEFVLSQNEKFTHSFLSEKRENILPETKKDQWTLYNLQEDYAFFHSFVLQKIKQQAEQNKSTIAKIKEVFTGESKEQELENFFFDTLALIADGQAKDTLSFLHDFEEKVRSFAKKEPEKAEAFLSSTEKSLTFVLPDSPFFPVKERVSVLKSEISKTLLAAEKSRTERLWQASALASAGHTIVAKSIVQESTDFHAQNTEKMTPEILGERESQMVALAQIEEQEELSDFAEDAQEELIEKTKTALVRPGFPHTSVNKNNTKKAQEIIRKVKKYKSITGQHNTLLAQLHTIKNTAENISLVIEIKNRLPDNLQGEAQRKILDILAAERKKH